MDNPLWGAPRIHGELLKLGFEVAQSSVAKYMVRQRGPRGQGWLTFLRNHAPDIAAMAPLRRPDDRLQPPLCIRNRSDTAQRPRLDQRHKGSDGRMGCTPNYRGISLGRSSKISPSRPGSNLWGSRHTSITYHGHSGQTHRTGFTLANCFAERLIGSMRRECLDHIVVFGEAHLRRILRSYARYYNDIRTHRSLCSGSKFRAPDIAHFFA